MKKLVLLFLCTGFITLFIIPAQAQEFQQKWGDVKQITTDELKTIYDAKEDFILINALSPIEFAEERITGSINVPYMHLKQGKAKLPDDKNKRLIFYCKGPK